MIPKHNNAPSKNCAQWLRCSAVSAAASAADHPESRQSVYPEPDLPTAWQNLMHPVAHLKIQSVLRRWHLTIASYPRQSHTDEPSITALKRLSRRADKPAIIDALIYLTAIYRQHQKSYRSARRGLPVLPTLFVEWFLLVEMTWQPADNRPDNLANKPEVRPSIFRLIPVSHNNIDKRLKPSSTSNNQ